MENPIHRHHATANKRSLGGTLPLPQLVAVGFDDAGFQVGVFLFLDWDELSGPVKEAQDIADAFITLVGRIFEGPLETDRDCPQRLGNRYRADPMKLDPVCNGPYLGRRQYPCCRVMSVRAGQFIADGRTIRQRDERSGRPRPREGASSGPKLAAYRRPEQTTERRARSSMSPQTSPSTRPLHAVRWSTRKAIRGWRLRRLRSTRGPCSVREARCSSHTAHPAGHPVLVIPQISTRDGATLAGASARSAPAPPEIVAR